MPRPPKPRRPPPSSSTKNFPPSLRRRCAPNNPYLLFARAISLFYQPPQYSPAFIPRPLSAQKRKFGKNSHIGAYVAIDDGVTIGDNAVILPHVVIYRGVTIGNNFFAHAHAQVRGTFTIGNNVVLQNGVIIGASGFSGFAKDNDGNWKKSFIQTTILEDNVEVQANACIDRASVGETRIGRDSKVTTSSVGARLRRR